MRSMNAAAFCGVPAMRFDRSKAAQSLKPSVRASSALASIIRCSTARLAG